MQVFGNESFRQDPDFENMKVCDTSYAHVVQGLDTDLVMVASSAAKAIYSQSRDAPLLNT